MLSFNVCGLRTSAAANLFSDAQATGAQPANTNQHPLGLFRPIPLYKKGGGTHSTQQQQAVRRAMLTEMSWPPHWQSLRTVLVRTPRPKRRAAVEATQERRLARRTSGIVSGPLPPALEPPQQPSGSARRRQR